MKRLASVSAVLVCVFGFAPVLKAQQAPATAAAAIVSAERSGIYADGKEVAFIVRPLPGGPALTNLSLQVLANDAATVSGVQTQKGPDSVTLRFTPPAGWYVCRAALPGPDGKPVTSLAGVVVSPERFAAATPEPADFDAFWTAKKAELAAVPLDAKLRPLSDEQKQNDGGGPDHEKANASLEQTGFERFDVEVACVPGVNPVRGYLARPKDAKPKSCPAVLMLHAAGVSGFWCKADSGNALRTAKAYGAIVLDVNAHGYLNGQPDSYYKQLEQGELKNYSQRDKEDRDRFYFVGMYLRLIRAIDFIAAQSAWDGKHLVCIGESQGGGQSLAAAGLDGRVSAVAAVVPAMCDWAGGAAGRPAGWPKPVGPNPAEPGAQKVLQAVAYCDNVYLCRRSKAHTLVFVGLIDTTCPAPGVFAAFNAVPSSKQIVAYPHKPHQGLPTEDVWVGKIEVLRDAFIRKHLAE